ncbi:MAG: diguanylate cyclase domain-containing protein [Wenzhouxiangella sp.]
MSTPREFPAARNPVRRPIRDALQSVRTSLKSRLIVALLLVAWLPALIALPLHYVLIERNVSEHARQQIEQLSAVQQRRINRELDRLLDSLALIGSRTQLRLSLDEFNRTGQAEAQAFVARILSDAVGSSEQVIGSWVHAPDGELVAGIGPVREPRAIVGQLLEGEQQVIFPYWRSEPCDAQIWLGMPLVLERQMIGRLSMQVDSGILSALLADFPDPGLIGESVLVLHRPDGQRCALAGAMAPRPDGDSPGFVTLAEQAASRDSVIRYENADTLLLALPLKNGFGELILRSVPNLQRELRASLLAGYGFILVGVVLLSGIFSIWISNRLAAPLGRLARAVGDVERGKRLPGFDNEHWPKELQALAEALTSAVASQRRMLSALRQEIRVRRATQTQLLDLANSDELTGLANRRYFIQRLGEQLKMADSENAALLYLDLDRFKPINDTHGHEAGDTVLKAIAERLKNVIREQDIAARLGGDEFAVLLRDSQEHPVDPERIARRIEEVVCQPIAYGEVTVHIGCSIGITPLTDGLDVQGVLSRADLAMYTVKQQHGRDLRGG